MKKTIQECEHAGIKGEEKFRATSLESMIDFSTSNLGEEVTTLSTAADISERKLYRIKAVMKKPSEKAVVVCHQQEYAYAVFYCHKTDTTVAYEVSLVGAGRAKADAVTVCHRDTAQWNPKHLAFQVLKSYSGTDI
ncbi:BURP domain-containing protein [Perilla frutescens var. hirtella]|uniref:BURP domain-containing protein n=1 Tax=Perilla frutescens var. hirtella TaxID=608512 RepID=A0AAD4J1W5_PERFH|nr:BURP domain-containing protein [Perilla frutescens var. hirtella]